MMQELLGGAALIGGERKISISGTILEATQPLPSSSPSPSLSPSSTTTATASSAATNSSTSASENLRCPRCDSTNTKFCYYNNYNLTQPRHFCKTCRRYWTKGGALRNVPIGGGCRKNKSTTSASPASVGRSSSGKIKTFASEIGRSGGFGSGFDTDFASSPILWASPHNSHLLALLRGDQNPNPSGLPGSISVKDEGAMIGIGTQVIAEPAVATGALNARILGLEPMSQASSVGLCSPFWKNNQHLQAQQQPQNGFLVGGDAQNSGLQELYQRLKSSTSYYNDSSPVVLGNVGAAAISTSSSSSSTILDSSPVVAGELGYWNPTFSWSDLPN